jgi:hypothetical protein
MLLKVVDGAKTMFPKFAFPGRLFRQILAAQNFRMHAHDENLLVIGAVKNADVSALREAARRAPQKIMLQFPGARMLEAENLASLRIDAGHDVLDRAVLASGVHRLKNQQQRIAVVGVKQALPFAQFLNVRFEDGFVILLRFVKRLYPGRPLFETDRLAFADAELFGFNFHVSKISTDDGSSQSILPAAFQEFALLRGNAT